MLATIKNTRNTSNTVRKASILILPSPLNLENLGSGPYSIIGNGLVLHCDTCGCTGWICIDGCGSMCDCGFGNGNWIGVCDKGLSSVTFD